jgi:hypothetical protein
LLRAGARVEGVTGFGHRWGGTLDRRQDDRYANGWWVVGDEGGDIFIPDECWLRDDEPENVEAAILDRGRRIRERRRSRT